MSAFCLDLQTSAVVSAPLELDSDCMEPRAGAAAQEPGGVQGHPLRHTGSGGLGMALEEELAMLAGEQDGEEELSDLETPAVGQNSDLLSLFRQKEKDLVLAAKLGKALLERNQDLTKQYEKMHKDLNEKLEVNLEKENRIYCFRPVFGLLSKSHIPRVKYGPSQCKQTLEDHNKCCQFHIQAAKARGCHLT